MQDWWPINHSTHSKLIYNLCALVQKAAKQVDFHRGANCVCNLMYMYNIYMYIQWVLDMECLYMYVTYVPLW